MQQRGPGKWCTPVGLFIARRSVVTKESTSVSRFHHSLTRPCPTFKANMGDTVSAHDHSFRGASVYAHCQQRSWVIFRAWSKSTNEIELKAKSTLSDRITEWELEWMLGIRGLLLLNIWLREGRKQLKRENATFPSCLYSRIVASLCVLYFCIRLTLHACMERVMLHVKC